jgi:DNA (cytosine-5)-methyltransferase 1
MDAMRSLRDQCARLGIAFHHKQNGGIRPKSAGCLNDGVEHKSFPLAGRMRALDLYCGAGGATRDLQLAGFHVTGIDLFPQPNYIGDRFIQADVLTLAPDFLAGFDFVHSSPPCQALSTMRHVHNAKPHLIPATRELLRASGRPYVIENVEGARAHLIDPILLCGTMFGLGAEGRELRRHRLFETSFPVSAPTCNHSNRPVLGIYGAHVRVRRRPAGRNHVSGSNLPISVGRPAMGMDWVHGRRTFRSHPAAIHAFRRR